MTVIGLADGIPPRPPLWPDLKRERIEWAWRQYELKLERMNWLHDDALPCLSVTTGTELFAEAFGCKVHRPAGDNPFALPRVASASEAARLKVPDLGARPLADVFEIADELRRRGGPEALLQMADIQSPMDIAALIWNKNTFYMALALEPEAVQELALKVRELLCAFLDEWFRRYGAEFIAHFPDYFMPRGITLSEDEIGAVSPEIFEDLFLPHLVYLAERYGRIGIHCCANSRHQWDGLRKIPNLAVLNIAQPPEVTHEAYRFFARDSVQMHSWGGEGDPWQWPAQLPPGARAVFQPIAASNDQAREWADRLREARERSD